MTKYYQLELSEHAIYCFDELLTKIQLDEGDIVQHCAKIAGVVKSLLDVNRKKGLIPP